MYLYIVENPRIKQVTHIFTHMFLSHFKINFKVTHIFVHKLSTKPTYISKVIYVLFIKNKDVAEEIFK